LVSCNPLLYPDILNLCHRGTHPQQGRVVYIDEGLVDPLKTYTLLFIGADTCVCDTYVPKLVTTTQDNCTPSYGIFKYVNCETGVSRNFGFPVADPINAALRVDGTCDCWLFSGEEANADELITAYTEYSSCNECLETRESELCPSAERTIGYAVRVNLPDSPAPDRGFSKCCYTNLVLADISDTDEYKNDFAGAYFKRETPSSTVVFKLVNTQTLTEYFLNSDTYGIFQPFGGVQADLSYYIVEWRKVLTLLGAGTYQIKKEVDIAGISVDIFSNTYTLKPFSIDTADKTVRLDSYMDGRLINIDTDFKGSGYKTSVRLRGFFGRNERSFEQDNIAQRDYNLIQNTMSSKSTYQFQGLQIPECITDEIWNFLIFGNELVISDYNKNNHSYKYELIPVILEDNSGTEFFVLDRAVNINLQFTDRRQNSRKINC
ncbi:MAG: hypothetical protein ACR2M9_03205, partial [Cyanophyceae cyanobacterium]